MSIFTDAQQRALDELPENLPGLKKAQFPEGDIKLGVVLRAGLDRVIEVDFEPFTQPSGGATTTVLSFQLRTPDGKALKEVTRLQMAVFTDVQLQTLSGSATLNAPIAAGASIITGAGANALEIETNADGFFSITLTDASDGTRRVGTATLAFGSPMLDHRQVAVVLFSA